MTLKEISQCYNGNFSSPSIRNRLEKYYKEQNKDLAKMILNLVKTRKATTKQLKKIADLYGVDLDKIFNSLEER